MNFTAMSLLNLTFATQPISDEKLTCNENHPFVMIDKYDDNTRIVQHGSIDSKKVKYKFINPRTSKKFSPIIDQNLSDLKENGKVWVYESDKGYLLIISSPFKRQKNADFNYMIVHSDKNTVIQLPLKCENY